MVIKLTTFDAFPITDRFTQNQSLLRFNPITTCRRCLNKEIHWARTDAISRVYYYPW